MKQSNQRKGHRCGQGRSGRCRNPEQGSGLRRRLRDGSCSSFNDAVDIRSTLQQRAEILENELRAVKAKLDQTPDS